MRTLLLCSLLLLSPNLSSPTAETYTVGRWKLTRKVPEKGPNRCYVDELSLYEDNSFKLIFKTLIANEYRVYTYTGEINNDGEAAIELGDGIARLVKFSQVKNQVDFRFKYGDKLGMFCQRDEHPYPHKHLPHDLIGQQLTTEN